MIKRINARMSAALCLIIILTATPDKAVSGTVQRTRAQIVSEALSDAKNLLRIASNRTSSVILHNTPLYIKDFSTYGELVPAIKTRLDQTNADDKIFVYDSSSIPIDSSETNLPLCNDRPGGNTPIGGTRGGKVYFCPAFFHENRFERMGTFLHEFYHLGWESNECAATEAQQFINLLAGKYPKSNHYMGEDCPGLTGTVAYNFMLNGNYGSNEPFLRKYIPNQTVKVARSGLLNDIKIISFADGAFECYVDGTRLNSYQPNQNFIINSIDNRPATMGNGTTEVILGNKSGNITITCAIPADILLSAKQFLEIIGNK